MEKIKKTATKDAIYEAYEMTLAKVKELESGKVDPVKVVAEKKKADTIAVAKEVIELNILNPEIIEKYNKVEEAIKIKEAELKEVFEIEKEAYSLTALVNAQADQTASFEADMQERRVELNNSILDLRKRYDLDMASLRQQYADLKAELEKTRKREIEEYGYDIKRTRSIENDEWSDKKAAREKELADREDAISSRESHVDELGQAIVELEAELEKVPALVATAKQEGADAKERELKQVNAIALNSAKREAEFEGKLKDAQIASLTEKVEASEAANKELRAKLDDAYIKMNELATKTVQSSGVKIIDSNGKNRD